ncbi:MAG: AraC family transcriptional regulator [Acidobacteriota bacterium]
MTTNAPIARLAEAAGTFFASRAGGLEHPTDLSDLLVIGSRHPTRLEPMLYEPSFCLIVQGAKSVQVGRTEIRLAAGDAIVVSHHQPVLAKVTDATSHKPFLALAFSLDLSLLHQLREEIGPEESVSPAARSLEHGSADPALVETASRLFSLIGRPREARVLAPLVRRELHFRVVEAPQGRTVRALLEHRSQASQVARAIAALRRDFTRSLSAAELAKVAGMSESSFYQHFRDTTSTTPLQYQKSLRLLEARRLLTSGSHNVTGAALEVGYQSPSQFSREYSRHFGHPPRHDLPSTDSADAPPLD